MENLNRGFTLIELLIVIAIVGILAAVALPLYKMHIIRARLTEVENAMANVKSAISVYRQETESWPICPTINEVRNSLGVGLGSVDRVSGISVINGIITATVQNVDPTVDGKSLILTPSLNGDGSFTWAWGASPNFPTFLIPKG